MNPFSGLITQVTAPSPRSARLDPDCPLEYEVTVRRVYRPTGATAAMLRALEARGEMSSIELATAGGVPPRQVGGILRHPIQYGLVSSRVVRGRRLWDRVTP